MCSHLPLQRSLNILFPLLSWYFSMLWQHFVYPNLEFQPFYYATHCCGLELPIPNGYSFSWTITRHILHRRLHLKTTGRPLLNTATCLLTCASRGSCCASQSFLSVRMQEKMVVFALQNCEWIGLHWLNSRLFLDVVKWSWSTATQILAVKAVKNSVIEYPYLEGTHKDHQVQLLSG